MRNEDHGCPVVDETAERDEQFVDLFRNKNCGRFIENENSGAPKQHFDDLNALTLSDAEFADWHIEIKVGTDGRHDVRNSCASLCVIDNASTTRFASENDVLENGEVVGEHEVLVHHADASIDCITRRLETALGSFDRNRSRVRLLHSVERLHQG